MARLAKETEVAAARASAVAIDVFIMSVLPSPNVRRANTACMKGDRTPAGPPSRRDVDVPLALRPNATPIRRAARAHTSGPSRRVAPYSASDYPPAATYTGSERP